MLVVTGSEHGYFIYFYLTFIYFFNFFFSFRVNLVWIGVRVGASVICISMITTLSSSREQH